MQQSEKYLERVNSSCGSPCGWDELGLGDLGEGPRAWSRMMGLESLVEECTDQDVFRAAGFPLTCMS